MASGRWIALKRELILEYLKESGVPRTSLYTGFYIENFLNPMMAPKKIGDDSYLLTLTILPDRIFPSLMRLTTDPIFAYPVNDTGAWVQGYEDCQ